MSSIKHLLTIILFPLIFFSCGSSNDDGSEIENIYAGASNTFDGDLHAIVEKYKLIPLETTDSTLISSIKKIVLKNNEIFLLEKFGSTSKIFSFSEHGKNIGIINSNGRGPQEYIDISDFDIRPDNRVVSIVDPATRKIMDFDPSGLFKQQYQITPAIKNLCYFQSNRQVRAMIDTRASMVAINRQNNFKLFMIDEKMSIIDSFFPFTEPAGGSVTMGTGLNLYPINEMVIGYYSPNTDSIFHINLNGEMKLKYSIAFDKEVLPIDKIQKVLSGEVSLKDYIVFVNYFEGANYMVISFTENNTQYLTIHNKSSKKNITIRAPLNPPNCRGCNSLLNILSVYEDYFIISCDKENLEALLSIMDPKLVKCETPKPFEIVASISEDSNPVLVMIKFSI